MQKLRDRTYVITGGTGTIGRALTLHLTGKGADVAIIDTSAEKARRIGDEVAYLRETNDSHGKVAYFDANPADKASVKEAISRATEAFGAIDVLVSALCHTKPAEITSADYLNDLEKLIDVNLKGAVYATHGVVPFMKGRKRGKIIYLVPDLARLGGEGESLTSVTRGGLTCYARALARELAPFNITVNCLATGPTEDDLLARDPKATSLKATEESLLRAVPLARMMKSEEIANVLVFLASGGADAVTGQTWAVNSGMTMF